jgi:Tol biopolymer transport system component
METAASNQGTNGPDISPDGRTLYYVRQNPSTKPPNLARTIVARDLATGTEVELKSGWFSAIALSRDGRHLAYLGSDVSGTAKTNQIAVISTQGGPSRALVEGEWPANNRSNIITWDPQGRFVYFVRQESGVATLWRVAAAGGTAERTTVSFKGNMVGPHIHPDGKRVAFTGSERNPPELWLLENYLPTNGTRK